MPLARDALRFAGAAVGGFVVLNLAGDLVRPPFSTLHDWVTLPATAWIRNPFALSVAVALAAGALSTSPPRVLLRAGPLLFGATAGIAAFDVASFYAALARGRIHTPAIVPASLLVALFFLALLVDLRTPRTPAPPGRARTLVRLAAFAAVILALPMIRMLTFGPTRYERSADCAVVFGARVWNDGTPSNALADRIDESIRLHRQGRVGRIVMSGGIDRHNGFSEPEVMRARAEAAGVPRAAILLDEDGVDTASTVRNVAALLRKERLSTALVVSHYYHEPRAKMLFDRAGVRAFTVPATMTRRLYREPYFLLREVLAFYHSFLLE